MIVNVDSLLVLLETTRWDMSIMDSGRMIFVVYIDDITKTA